MTQDSVANCNLCGGSSTVLLYRPVRSPGPVVRCTKCGLVYVNPLETTEHIISESHFLGVSDKLRLSSDPEVLEQRWEKALVEEYLAEYRPKMRNAHRLLAAIEAVVPKGRILDFGAGPGLFAAAAKERGWEAFGLEPLVGFAVCGRARFGLDIVNGFLGDDTYPESYFDVITVLQVLEHLRDPLDTLRKLRRIIRPGGLLVVEVPSISNTWARLLGSRHRHFVEDHLYFFSPLTLRLMLEKAGFQVVKEGQSSRSISVRSCVLQIARHLGASPSVRTRLESLMRRKQIGAITLRLTPGDIIFTFALRQHVERAHDV